MSFPEVERERARLAKPAQEALPSSVEWYGDFRNLASVVPVDA